MLTSCVLVGRVKEKPEVTMSSKGTTMATLLLETERPFRNENGSVSHDVFRIFLWRGIAEECAQMCSPGSIVAVRGRMQSTPFEREDGRTWYNCEIFAEKVSYIPQG
ncbi:MAG: single-stranded DNA-binding protein [Solobacterium sp.]|nr:single-stranded DNA-binding protein [Solobacterium sp.]